MRFKSDKRPVLLLTTLALTVLGVPSSQAAPKATQAPRRVIKQPEQITYASWYGWGFARRPTASGELFNPMALTAAHRTLPLGSRVRVTNLTNGRSVILRITDRGPYKKGRGIDVSHEAARRLRMVRQGVAKVRVEHLVPPAMASSPVLTTISGWPSGLDGPRALSL
jgi:rare lipoprotein A (peptidoglycan hydrolase)